MKSSSKTGWQATIRAALSRAVCGVVLFAATQSAHPFVIASSQQMDFNGHNVRTDSFDSQDPGHSIDGRYPFVQAMQKDNGDIAVVTTITNSSNVGEAWIKGRVQTGPGGGIVLGPSGSVGSKGWVEGGTIGIEPGYGSEDMNIVFPNVVLPSTTWSPGSWVVTNIDGFRYDYVFWNDGDYTIPGDFSYGFFVGTNAHVRVRITSAVTTMNLQNDGIRIAPGGTLEIYMIGGTFKVAGRGIVNDSGNAANLALFALPSCTNIQFNSDISLTGVIYAPQAILSLGGGGPATNEFVGSIIAKSVKLNGEFNFHFDENLWRIGRQPPRILASPQSQTNLMGSTATFNVTASGALGCQWYCQNISPPGPLTVIPGATNSTFVVSNAPYGDRYYSVTVSNAFGVVGSAPARLFVYSFEPVLSLSAVGPDQLVMEITGIPGTNYAVYASTNLFDWEPLRTNASPFSIAQTNVGVFPQRFFRAVYSP